MKKIENKQKKNYTQTNRILQTSGSELNWSKLRSANSKRRWSPMVWILGKALSGAGPRLVCILRRCGSALNLCLRRTRRGGWPSVSLCGLEDTPSSPTVPGQLKKKKKRRKHKKQSGAVAVTSRSSHETITLRRRLAFLYPPRSPTVRLEAAARLTRPV